MPTYLSPGVYVEETDSGSRPIEGVGTAVAAFVGLAEKGPFNQPTLVSNWTQFTKTFGGFVDGACLAESVFAYFQNGGGNAFIVRIGDGAGENGSSAKPTADRGGATGRSCRLPGRWPSIPKRLRMPCGSRSSKSTPRVRSSRAD